MALTPVTPPTIDLPSLATAETVPTLVLPTVVAAESASAITAPTAFTPVAIPPYDLAD